MAHFNFVISQNAKWGHAGFYIDCHRMTVPENILLQKSTGWIYGGTEVGRGTERGRRRVLGKREKKRTGKRERENKEGI